MRAWTLSARLPKELVPIITATTSTLRLGYLDRKRIIVLDEEGGTLWTGTLGTPMNPVKIDEILNAPSKSALASERKGYRTEIGMFTTVESPDGEQSYLWHGNVRQIQTDTSLSICRPQDFLFTYDEGGKLVVLAEERQLFAAGHDMSGYIAVSIVAGSNDLESAEVFRGAQPDRLRRKPIYSPHVIGSRLQVRVGNAGQLQCDVHGGMRYNRRSVPLVDPKKYNALEIDHAEGQAKLIKV